MFNIRSRSSFHNGILWNGPGLGFQVKSKFMTIKRRHCAKLQPGVDMGTSINHVVNWGRRGFVNDHFTTSALFFKSFHEIGGVKISQNLPMLFMDGPYGRNSHTYYYLLAWGYISGLIYKDFSSYPMIL